MQEHMQLNFARSGLLPITSKILCLDLPPSGLAMATEAWRQHRPKCAPAKLLDVAYHEILPEGQGVRFHLQPARKNALGKSPLDQLKDGLRIVRILHGLLPTELHDPLIDVQLVLKRDSEGYFPMRARVRKGQPEGIARRVIIAQRELPAAMGREVEDMAFAIDDLTMRLSVGGAVLANSMDFPPNPNYWHLRGSGIRTPLNMFMLLVGAAGCARPFVAGEKPSFANAA